MKFAFALLIALAGFFSSVAWAQQGAVNESSGCPAPSSVLCACVAHNGQA